MTVTVSEYLWANRLTYYVFMWSLAEQLKEEEELMRRPEA